MPSIWYQGQMLTIYRYLSHSRISHLIVIQLLYLMSCCLIMELCTLCWFCISKSSLMAIIVMWRYAWMLILPNNKYWIVWIGKICLLKDVPEQSTRIGCRLSHLVILCKIVCINCTTLLPASTPWDP